MATNRTREQGSTLIVSLVFLLVFLVMALSIFRGSLTSAQAIGNMQWRNEAISAANQAIDSLLSTSSIATDAPYWVGQANNQAAFRSDVYGDRKNFITVTFPDVTLNVNGEDIVRAGPRCLAIEEIPAEKLSPTKTEDAGCFMSSSAGGIAVEGSGGATSPPKDRPLCAESQWSMMVRATDAATAANVDVVQGFDMRVLTYSVPVSSCN